MPRRIRIKHWTHNGSDWYWRTLCIVYDNEALGLLERMLTAQGFEFKVEDA